MLNYNAFLDCANQSFNIIVIDNSFKSIYIKLSRLCSLLLVISYSYIARNENNVVLICR